MDDAEMRAKILRTLRRSSTGWLQDESLAYSLHTSTANVRLAVATMIKRGELLVRENRHGREYSEAPKEKSGVSHA